MSRLGIDWREASSLFELLRSSPEVRLEGVLSHLAEAETPESASNRLQQDRFGEVLALLSPAERAAIAVHLANSAAALHLPAARFDWVRLGIALYGYDSAEKIVGGLEPVLSVAAEIVQVKTIPPGTRVGYGGRWVAARPSRIGIVPVGYADGYSWRLGNRAEVLVAGRRVPVVGSVSIDLLAVDLSDLSELSDLSGVGAEVDPGHAPRAPGRRGDLGGRARRRGRTMPSSCFVFSACDCRGGLSSLAVRKSRNRESRAAHAGTGAPADRCAR